jgi:hypothetical protein
MKLPIFHIKFMERTVDLSALVEVTDAELIDRDGYGGWYVGFSFRFAGDSGFRQFSRSLRDDELREQDPQTGQLLRHPLLAVVNENGPPTYIDPRFRSDLTKFDLPLAVKNMRAEMQELLDAWARWKEIEPQVYALLKP